ncbi:lasso peptide biosynthesis PqqD family chaperone [Streptomyces litchfieldiae]|uniref:Lasso peptide biosynthesis PqqD family chaperone n=1 Tax=Streptomyces litchfieldiae TaxID=3075543 RepID=A0ABU2MXP7_9ACTN|nr:lasso peptide biosynthesis PqqD family chaperone [Streptomyces sp. DSM 44938]MDT0346395.1 lasso peptide biosynthesis PqqD family chaperone [Streptomyces sp. DSM 44938]
MSTSMRLSPDVVTCDTDDGLVLLDSRRGRYWQLNATGAAIVRGLLAGAAVERIATELSRKQPVTADRAAEDIRTLVDQLTRARLIEGENAS